LHGGGEQSLVGDRIRYVFFSLSLPLSRANPPFFVDESDQSLTFLSTHFPEFCYIKTVNGSERWICLAGGMRALEVKEKVREELARIAKEMQH
jgi:hypothetical protein